MVIVRRSSKLRRPASKIAGKRGTVRGIKIMVNDCGFNDLGSEKYEKASNIAVRKSKGLV